MTKKERQMVARTIKSWIRFLRVWRLVTQKCSSHEADEPFITDAVNALMDDLDESPNKRIWNKYTVRGEDGRKVVLNIEMYIDCPDEENDGE